MMAHPGRLGTFPAVRQTIMDTKSNCSRIFYSNEMDIRVNVKKVVFVGFRSIVRLIEADCAVRFNSTMLLWRTCYTVLQLFNIFMLHISTPFTYCPRQTLYVSLEKLFRKRYQIKIQQENYNFHLITSLSV